MVCWFSENLNVRTTKNIRSVFQTHSLKNIFQTNFLDIFKNLRSGPYEPFKKDNCKIKNINNKSNHLKNIRKIINSMIKI